MLSTRHGVQAQLTRGMLPPPAPQGGDCRLHARVAARPHLLVQVSTHSLPGSRPLDIHCPRLFKLLAPTLWHALPAAASCWKTLAASVAQLLAFACPPIAGGLLWQAASTPWASCLLAAPTTHSRRCGCMLLHPWPA